MSDHSSVKQIFDALTGGDDCPSDWCAEVLERASPEDVDRVNEALSHGTEDEAAYELGVVN